MTLFYMLGLKSASIRKIYVREFTFLILMCFVLSLIFGSALTSIMMKFIFDSEAVLRPFFIVPVMALIGMLLFVIVNIRVGQLVKIKSLF